MSYWMELRQHVGSQPLILAGACVLLADEKNRLLLLQRSDTHCWWLPGDTLEPGESLA
jgi:ADP-ribose pyrophosphatase YjhB (NUDIX family)